MLAYVHYGDTGDLKETSSSMLVCVRGESAKEVRASHGCVVYFINLRKNNDNFRSRTKY